jgi:hypothetical protein
LLTARSSCALSVRPVRGGAAVVDASTDLTVTPDDDNPAEEEGATTATDANDDEDGLPLTVFLSIALERILDLIGL